MGAMAKGLRNPNHERFCREYIKLGNGSAAYRKIWTVKDNKVSQACASRLRHKPYIKARIEEMQMEIRRKADISFEKILNDYQYALEMAKANQEPGNIIAAAREQARLVGLLVDRRESGQPGDFDQMENISEILEAVEKQAGPEAAMALAKAFGVIADATRDAVQIENAPAGDAEALIEAKPGSDAVN